MSLSVVAAAVLAEPLTPHDLVTYFRCPHEMELAHARRRSVGAPGLAAPLSSVCTPPDVVPLRQSLLPPPPLTTLNFNEGRLDLFPADRLVYQDEGEAEELPVLFPPEQVRAEPLFRRHGPNLVDEELALSGRPDLIIERPGGVFVPLEYKSTHPFHGLHAVHGRTFDLIQVLAECRLVESASGRRPPYGLLLYGDVVGNGQHEGWFQVPYTASEAEWVRRATEIIRADRVRPPVPSERTCSSCPAHRDGLCRYAAARYVGAESARERFHAARP